LPENFLKIQPEESFFILSKYLIDFIIFIRLTYDFPLPYLMVNHNRNPQLMPKFDERSRKMENQVKLLENIHDQFEFYKKRIPDVGEAYERLPAEVYKGGVLTGKTKRLMALCAALTHGCRACILFQANEALTLGASVDEVLETCAVAISIGGTMAAGETTRVVGFLADKNLI
jgi:AhpD family alkylhydroperoxidase